MSGLPPDAPTMGQMYRTLVKMAIERSKRTTKELMHTPTSPVGPIACRVAEIASLLSWLEDMPREVLDRADFPDAMTEDGRVIEEATAVPSERPGTAENPDRDAVLDEVMVAIDQAFRPSGRIVRGKVRRVIDEMRATATPEEAGS